MLFLSILQGLLEGLEDNGLGATRAELIKALDERFFGSKLNILKEKSYLVATFLDPRYINILSAWSFKITIIYNRNGSNLT